MQRKAKIINISYAKNAYVLLNLPCEVLFFYFFSSLLVADLLKTKKISKAFKNAVDTYINESESNIFYAASTQCRVPIGDRISYAELLRDNNHEPIYDYVEYPAHPFDADYINLSRIKRKMSPYFYEFSNSENSSMLLFGSEIEALNFFRFPGTESSGCLAKLSDLEKPLNPPRKLSIQVSPIYKVQVIHFNTVIEKEVKDCEKKLKPNTVKAGNLLPLTASIKFRFFAHQPLKTILDNIDITESRQTPCRCVIQ